MDKQIKIGDKTWNLRFTLGTLEHLANITEQDAITYLSTAGINMVHGCSSLIGAAALSYVDNYGGTVDLEEIKKYIRTKGDLRLFADIAKMYNEFVNPNLEAEGKEASQSTSRKSKSSPIKQD